MSHSIRHRIAFSPFAYALSYVLTVLVVIGATVGAIVLIGPEHATVIVLSGLALAFPAGFVNAWLFDKI